MKFFSVSGLAVVPVSCKFTVSAKNADEAMKKANEIFKLDRNIRHSSVVIGSEDFGAIHDFDATNAEESK